MATSFSSRSQTFGLDQEVPWALPALRLLYSAPRVYQPLADAWDARFPGNSKTLKDLVEEGFVAYQGPVVVDTVSGKLATRPGRPVRRFRLTAKGERILDSALGDVRTLTDQYPRMSRASTVPVMELLEFFSVNEATRKTGFSIQHAVAHTRMPEQTAKWWIRRWIKDKVLKELPHLLADTREAIPAHYRIRRELTSQIRDVIKAYPGWATLTDQLRLGRKSYLGDIYPARIGPSGATDFDHDVKTQQILAQFIHSPSFLANTQFLIEPKYELRVSRQGNHYQVRRDGAGSVFYQPDALFRQRGDEGFVRNVLEYERFQSRRDAWNHVERFLGFAHLYSRGEEVALRFVVNTRSRERGYVHLCEAVADYNLDYPQNLPTAPATLLVSSLERLEGARDPLSDAYWFRVPLPEGSADPEEGTTRLHPASKSPYDLYFST